MGGKPTFWKYIREDGMAVHGGKLRWAPENSTARKGTIIRHPSSRSLSPDAAHYLSASDQPYTWAWYGTRLLEIEPVEGEQVWLNSTDLAGADEYAALAWRIVREVDMFTVLLGPQGPDIRRLVEQVSELVSEEDHEELDALAVATAQDRHIVESVARDANRDPASLFSHDALRGVANAGTPYAGQRCHATRDALWALVARDLIGTPEHISGEPFTREIYDRLTLPYRRLVGPLHPADGASA